MCRPNFYCIPIPVGRCSHSVMVRFDKFSNFSPEPAWHVWCSVIPHSFYNFSQIIHRIEVNPPDTKFEFLVAKRDSPWNSSQRYFRRGNVGSKDQFFCTKYWFWFNHHWLIIMVDGSQPVIGWPCLIYCQGSGVDLNGELRYFGTKYILVELICLYSQHLLVLAVVNFSQKCPNLSQLSLHLRKKKNKKQSINGGSCWKHFSTFDK